LYRARKLGFSYSSLDAAGSGAALWAELIGSVGGLNILAAGIAVSVVARFGRRAGRRWAWWFLCFCFLWILVHDAIMTTRFFPATGQPFMVLPYSYCALMLGGLLRSRRVVFARATSRDSPSHDFAGVLDNPGVSATARHRRGCGGQP
jgi:hypothetical protein